MILPGDEDDKEILDGKGNEAQADAGAEQEPGEVGDDGEGTPEGDGAEAEEGLEADAGEEGEKPRSRAENRVQRLANEAKEAREEAAKVRRDFEEYKVSQRQQAQQESPETVAQRLALMTPEERLEYKLDQSERRNQQTMQAMAFRVQDTGDQAAFTALCAADPLAARYKDQVEAKLRDIRASGQNVNREALLDYLLGQETRTKAQAARTKQGKEGQRRIERQRVQPGNARGDAAPNKRGEKSLEDRLANVTF